MNAPARYVFTSLVFDVERAGEVCETALAALATEPWPPVTTWRAPRDGDPRTDALREALRADAAVAAAPSFEWYHGEKIRIAINRPPEGVELRIYISDTEPEHCWRWLVAIEELLVRLLERDPPIRSGWVQRIGVGVSCVPNLPVVGKASYMVVADEATLTWGFERPDEAIAAGGWEDARQIEGRWLLSRAMHAETNVEMFEAIQDGQWAMARLARPGLTEYEVREPEPEEEPIYLAGGRRVRALRYYPDDRIMMYSCYLEPDEHVRGFEVFALRRIVVEGKLHTGEEVEQVQVLFPERKTAEREKRPLLDAGVFVLYYDDDGKITQLDEPVT